MIITTPQYFLDIPENAVTNAVDRTKTAFTICMNTDPRDVVSKESLSRCVKSFGVQSVPFVLFDELEKVNQWVGKGAL